MRFATWDDGGVVTAGVVGEHGLHALPPDVTVLDLVRAGLPTALDAGLAALSAPAVPLAEVRLLPAAAAADGPRLRRVRGARRGRREERRRTAPASPEWYEAPTFYFTNPYALVGAHDDVAVPPGSRSCSTSSSRSPSSSAGTAPR